MANGKIPNINNKFYGDKLVEVTFPDSTGSLGFDEYNAVLNNANSSITSSKIMNADYALNARIPTNNDRLISGTAQRMEIQDSNYSSVAWTSPRYVGSKTISATYNDYQAAGTATFADGTTGTWKGDQVFDEYPGDETFTRGNPLGKVPAIDLYSTHFVLFDRIQIDEAFADGDIFHCLYLIDDQGNKQPLTYRNKNLVDLQRIFVKGSNAEVLFLGQNNQEVLDEYPILEVGKITSTRASFTNDIFKLNGNDYEPRFISTETAVSNAYIRHTFINDRQTDYTVRFVPSAFNVENEGNGIYKLTYSKTDIRNTFNTWPNPLFDEYPFRHSYYRQAKISPNTNTALYPFFDGSSSLNMEPQNHDSKFDPFYFLTWNPKTSKVFEGTLLEQKVEWNLFTPDPNNIAPNFTGVPTYPNLTVQSIGSVSQYTSEWSPIKINDEIVFGKFPISQQIETSLIGIPPPNGNTPYDEVIDNFRDYYDNFDALALKITEINYPFSQSYESVLFPQFPSRGGRFIFYDENGNISQQPSPTLAFSWVGQRHVSSNTDSYISIRNDISPNENTFPDNIVVHGSNGWGKISLFADDETYNLLSPPTGPEPETPLPGVFGMIMSIYDYSTIDRSSFLESLSHGDIIEFDVTIGANSLLSDGQGIARYQILQKPFYASFVTPSNDGYHLVLRLQYIPTENGRNNIRVRTNYTSPEDFGDNIFIKRIIKYRAPYIRVEQSTAINTQLDISSSINSSGSVLSTIGVNTHEQYITSQFLEGSGVGVLIPDNYDPKLREQLPDIINKTGIDINSLT